MMSNYSDFLKTLKENERIKNTAGDLGVKSYADYATSIGKNASEIAPFQQTVTALNTQAEKAKSGYGKMAQSLSDIGLTKSGFSSSVDASADIAKEAQIKSAYAKALESQKEARTAYGKYVQGKTEQYGADVIKASKGTMTPEEAQMYAEKQGYSGDVAKGYVDYATGKYAEKELGKAIDKYSDMISYAKSGAYTGDQAYQNAITRGLSESQAQTVRETAEKAYTETQAKKTEQSNANIVNTVEDGIKSGKYKSAKEIGKELAKYQFTDAEYGMTVPDKVAEIIANSGNIGEYVDGIRETYGEKEIADLSVAIQKDKDNADSILDTFCEENGVNEYEKAILAKYIADIYM